VSQSQRRAFTAAQWPRLQQQPLLPGHGPQTWSAVTDPGAGAGSTAVGGFGSAAATGAGRGGTGTFSCAGTLLQLTATTAKTTTRAKVFILYDSAFRGRIDNATWEKRFAPVLRPSGNGPGKPATMGEVRKSGKNQSSGLPTTKFGLFFRPWRCG
jgi:hypothetical protein